MRKELMILEYHRPKTLDEALNLLKRKQPLTRPLAGGTAIHLLHREDFAVVDLQDLGLDRVEMRGKSLALGAMLTLQAFLTSLDSLNLSGGNLANALGDVIRQEATLNIRNAATLGGTLAAASGRSPLATALLACDGEILLQPGNRRIPLGDWLPLRCAQGRPLRHEQPAGSLIVEVRLPTHISLAYAAVARTPADFPIVCAAAAGWPRGGAGSSGRRRIALGGYGPAPRLVIDGTESTGAGQAAQSAYLTAGDEWASAEYRAEMASILVERCIQTIGDPL
jgi:CO/xanthine dehydrogenase FAD-binding subunit